MKNVQYVYMDIFAAIHFHKFFFFSKNELVYRIFESHHEKTRFLHMRKQRRRSASR